MVKILVAPHPVLSTKAKSYNFNDRSLSKLLSQMKQALEEATDPKGVGLAAPQIGKSVSVFIAKPSEKGKASVFVNPQIIHREKLSKAASDAVKKRKAKKERKKLEGCLSLPDIWGVVERAPGITLSYFDETGKRHTKKFKGFLSTIVQHEVDHLEGALFPKHVLEQKGKLYQSHNNDKGEIIFEPIEI